MSIRSPVQASMERVYSLLEGRIGTTIQYLGNEWTIESYRVQYGGNSIGVLLQSGEDYKHLSINTIEHTVYSRFVQALEGA